MFQRRYLFGYLLGLLLTFALSYKLTSLADEISIALTGTEYTEEDRKRSTENTARNREWANVIESEIASRENERRVVLAPFSDQRLSEAQEWQLVPEKSVIERNLWRTAGKQMVILGPVEIEMLTVNTNYPDAKTLLRISAEVFPYTTSTQQISAIMFHDGLRWWLDDLNGYERQN